jgi:hopene-associated glycosyltransferase HpnB
LRAQQQEPEFILLTDADIVCSPEALGTLVARAEYEGLVLSSRMAALHCVSNAERLLIPAFVFFFQMIYPFRWVNDSRYRIAAAAGGCMLVRRAALERAGGLGSIRGEIIDDCALARRLKVQGPIRLALTRQVRSQRPYASTGDIGRMIARTAYAQLRYSPLLLTGTLLVMGIGYLAPPIITVCGALPAILGASAWAAMTFAFRPTLRLYDRALWWGLLLPAIAFVYVAFTIRSAHLHVRGRGGLWKGRTYG